MRLIGVILVIAECSSQIRGLHINPVLGGISVLHRVSKYPMQPQKRMRTSDGASDQGRGIKIPRIPQAQPHTDPLSIPGASYETISHQYGAAKQLRDACIRSQCSITKDCQTAIYHLHRGELDDVRFATL